MGHHHGHQIFFKQLLVGIEVDVPDSFFGVGDDREGVVTVCFGIPMPRKMLCIGKNAIFLQSFHVGNGSLGDPFLIFSEGAKSDYWIFGIGVDIHHGRKIHMHSQYLKLPGNFCAHLFDQIGILDGPKGHGFWKIEGRVQAHTNAPFRIHSNKQGSFGLGLVKVGESSLSIGASLKKYETS